MSDASPFEWADAVPWVLIIVGWLLVNAQHNSRESRKELRVKVDQFKKIVDEVEDAAVEHHTDSQTPIRCMKIKRAIAKLGKEISLMATAGLFVHRANQRVTRVRQAVTLKNFESHRYAVLLPSDLVIAEIGAATDDLRYSVEQAYVARFNKKLVRREGRDN